MIKLDQEVAHKCAKFVSEQTVEYAAFSDLLESLQEIMGSVPEEMLQMCAEGFAAAILYKYIQNDPSKDLVGDFFKMAGTVEPVDGDPNAD